MDDLRSTELEVINKLSIKEVGVLEEYVLQKEQAECQVIHRFAPGIYVREVLLPKEALVIGHEHKTEHFNVMLKGSLILLNEDGSKTRLDAPQSFTAGKGRKVAYIIEDVVWQNIFATSEKDINKLEEMFLDKSDNWKYNNKQLFEAKKVLREEDREDFLAAIQEFGYNEKEVRRISENTEDMLELDSQDLKVVVGDSAIEGKGLFATANIQKGDTILPARVGLKRTIAGRYANHSKHPNAIMESDEFGNVNLIAITDIKGCCGGELGEEITVDYRIALTESRRNGEKLCQELQQQR